MVIDEGEEEKHSESVHENRKQKNKLLSRFESESHSTGKSEGTRQKAGY